MTQKLSEEPLTNPFEGADEFRDYMARTDKEMAALRQQVRLLIQCVSQLMEAENARHKNK